MRCAARRRLRQAQWLQSHPERAQHRPDAAARNQACCLGLTRLCAIKVLLYEHAYLDIPTLCAEPPIFLST